ncbi:glycoside hydrolase family 3 C-terminal domain-containing protein, partial [Streptomyces sp. G44]|uniref:glycoside hydrolase family 3 C-terminal domain-containing protein n=1 Tax=Streptomyces sp. G44 TaxID=2807632 RepID=UPI001960A653
ARVAAGALDPALLVGRTDLPPAGTCAAAADATEFALVDWGEGAWTLRAPDGRYLSVAADGFVRASADQPGGWVVQETFAPVGREHGDGGGHAGGHLLRHTGTGGYVCVAADGVRVAADGEVLPAEHATPFTVEVLERGEDAVARAAADADTVIVVAGNDPHINGRETQDRTTLALPPHQDRLWRAARAANPRTALVLVSAYPYAVPDADTELPALLWTAHGGQAAGTALARVIAGDVSPAGRLPQTWYAADTDLPDLLDYDIIGSRQTYQYFDGTPLYPFGHGLGYSSFRYEDLTAERDGDALRVACTLTNTGAVTADEVAQLYTRAPRGPVALPHRRLAAHRRVRLAPGAWRRLAFRLPLTGLGFWDVRQDRWALPPGTYDVLAGASSRDIRLMTPVELTGEPLAARPVLAAGLAANGYDTQRGTELVDRTKATGDAVRARDDGTGELLYQACDFGDGVAAVTVEAAGEGAVDLIAGTTATTVTVAPTGGPYHYTSNTSGFAVLGVRDLRVRLRGPVRLARLAFTAAAPRKDAA